jgi:hypothetical protein
MGRVTKKPSQHTNTQPGQASPEKKSLDDKLAEWLGTQGYPLEMEVAQAFRAGGFAVGQSTYFLDPETEEAREIDVTAWHEKKVSDIDVRLTCFIECKLTPERPWVIFTSRREFGDELFDFSNYVATDLGSQCLMLLFQKGYFPLPLAVAFRDRIGYGATQGLREKNERLDLVYDAAFKAVKAAIARERAVNSLVKTEPEPSPIIEVAIPVIVIDAPLFEYYLESDLTKTLRRFHWGVWAFGNPIARRSEPTFIHVVTKQGLPEFVESMRKLSLTLQAVTTENLQSLQSYWWLILGAAGKMQVRRGGESTE